MLYFILLHFQTFYKFLTYFYTLQIYVLILLTSYLLENDRRSVETSFLIRDFYCVKFLKTLTFKITSFVVETGIGIAQT